MDPSDEDPKDAHKARSGTACLLCERGKRRCDGKRPCDRCLRLGRSERCVDGIAATRKQQREYRQRARIVAALRVAEAAAENTQSISAADGFTQDTSQIAYQPSHSNASDATDLPDALIYPNYSGSVLSSATIFPDQEYNDQSHQSGCPHSNDTLPMGFHGTNDSYQQSTQLYVLSNASKLHKEASQLTYPFPNDGMHQSATFTSIQRLQRGDNRISYISPNSKTEKRMFAPSLINNKNDHYVPRQSTENPTPQSKHLMPTSMYPTSDKSLYSTSDKSMYPTLDQSSMHHKREREDDFHPIERNVRSRQIDNPSKYPTNIPSEKVAMKPCASYSTPEEIIPQSKPSDIVFYFDGASGILVDSTMEFGALERLQMRRQDAELLVRNGLTVPWVDQDSMNDIYLSCVRNLAMHNSVWHLSIYLLRHVAPPRQGVTANRIAWHGFVVRVPVEVKISLACRDTNSGILVARVTTDNMESTNPVGDLFELDLAEWSLSCIELRHLLQELILSNSAESTEAQRFHTSMIDANTQNLHSQPQPQPQPPSQQSHSNQQIASSSQIWFDPIRRDQQPYTHGITSYKHPNSSQESLLGKKSNGSIISSLLVSTNETGTYGQKRPSEPSDEPSHTLTPMMSPKNLIPTQNMFGRDTTANSEPTSIYDSPYVWQQFDSETQSNKPTMYTSYMDKKDDTASGLTDQHAFNRRSMYKSRGIKDTDDGFFSPWISSAVAQNEPQTQTPQFDEMTGCNLRQPSITGSSNILSDTTRPDDSLSDIFLADRCDPLNLPPRSSTHVKRLSDEMAELENDIPTAGLGL